MAGSDGKRLYVGNLPWRATDEDLRDLFGGYGSLKEVKLMVDRDTGRSRGFAFVEFDDGPAAGKALKLDGEDFMGRPLTVKVAEARQSRR